VAHGSKKPKLHRAGEGAAYTGLKPADFGPVIPAAERAVEIGDLSQVKALLVEEIERSCVSGSPMPVRPASEARQPRKEPKLAERVERAHKRVSAEFASDRIP
jgi:hypothetical protein